MTPLRYAADKRDTFYGRDGARLNVTIDASAFDDAPAAARLDPALLRRVVRACDALGRAGLDFARVDRDTVTLTWFRHVILTQHTSSLGAGSTSRASTSTTPRGAPGAAAARAPPSTRPPRGPAADSWCWAR